MTDGFRAVLLPLLLISYVTGTRIIEFPTGMPRIRLSLIYVLLLWSIYFFLYFYTIHHLVVSNYLLYHICFWMDDFTTILSITLAIYYDKKFRCCLRKLAIIEDTLEKLGTITDYEKLYTRVLLIIFAWFTLVMFKTYNNSLSYIHRLQPMKAFYVASIIDYCPDVNLIDDLIIATILRYIEQKFEQINENVQKLHEHNDQIRRKHFMISARDFHPTEYTKYFSNGCVSWVIIHLHSELRKICRELNSIFGLQMTVKMGSYFIFLVLALWEFADLIFVRNHAYSVIIRSSVALTVFLLYTFRLILINYICDRVTVKANATGDLINKISYSSNDNVVHENISQLILQLTQAPIRFYGLGCFQFGLKFLYGFCHSVATVVVLLIQSYTNSRLIENKA